MFRKTSTVLAAIALLVSLSWVRIFADLDLRTNEWMSTGPTGGTITDLAIDPWDPDTIYAATPSGVFKTTDGGRRWKQTTAGRSMTALAIDPQSPAIVYAASGWPTPDILKSNDGGETWSATPGLSPVFFSSNIYDLVVDPRKPSIVYACTGQGILKSTDGGVGWGWVNTGLSGIARQVFSLAIDAATPDNLFAVTFQGIFRSTDGGANWSTTGLNNPVDRIVIDPTNPLRLYAGNGADLYRSIDGGSTWSQLDTPSDWLGLSALVINPQTPATLYAGTDHGIFRSLDAGAAWNVVHRAGARILVLAIDPLNSANVYAGAEQQGIIKSTDGGETWRHSNTGILLRETNDLAIDPRNPNVVYAATTGGVLKSTRPDSTWTQTSLTGWVSRLAIDSGDPATLYAAGVIGGICKGTEDGTTWTCPLGGPSATSLAVSLETPAAIYAGYLLQYGPGKRYFGVLRSTDGGESWRQTGLRLDSSYISALAIDPRTPTTIYAGTSGFYSGFSGNGIFRTMDGGASWSQINTGLGNHLRVRALAVDPHDPEALYAAVARVDWLSGSTLGGGVFKSSDGGGTWGAVNAGLTDLSVLALAVNPRTPTSIYAGTTQGGAFKSADGGRTWASLGAGLPTLPVVALAVGSMESTMVYAATRSGVFVLQENHPPIADPGADRDIECVSFAGSRVLLDGSASRDANSTPGTNDDIVQFDWFEDFGKPTQVRLGTGDILETTLPLGVHWITLRVTDSFGEAGTGTIAARVVDTAPPVMSVVPAPSVLWPPNHRMVPVAFGVSAQDVCDPAPRVALVSATSSEPEDAAGERDAHTREDIQGMAAGSPDTLLLLRAERDGSGPGRFYTIIYTGTDTSDNSAVCRTTVLVPRDQRDFPR